MNLSYDTKLRLMLKFTLDNISQFKKTSYYNLPMNSSRCSILRISLTFCYSLTISIICYYKAFSKEYLYSVVIKLSRFYTKCTYK